MSVATEKQPAARRVPTFPIPDKKPALRYPYEFKATDLNAIKRCNEEHGFAVVKEVIDHRWVDELRGSINATLDAKRDLAAGQTRFQTTFIEESPALLRLLDHTPMMMLYAHLLGTDEMTVHRSAAILKAVGAEPGAWHSDQGYNAGPPRNVNEVLNSHEWPNGFWFYLNGTHPSRGGLAVIEDSHVAGWRGPEGFELIAEGKMFKVAGEEGEHAYAGMDVPGCVPLLTDPGDLIVFAARTFHGVYPHHGSEPRHSCAIILRPGRARWPAPWALTPRAREFLANLPARYRRYFEGYVGIDYACKFGQGGA